MSEMFEAMLYHQFAERQKWIALPPFRFLELSLVVRLMIYRLLLCRDEPIGTHRDKFGLFPAILRTNRKIYLEAREMLYGVNTFSMRIFDKAGGKCAYFPKCENLAEEAEKEVGSHLGEMRRFSISVELHHNSELRNVKETVRHVASVFSRLPWLNYLHITLDGGKDFNAQALCRVLESFSALRDMRSVVLVGVPPVYAQYLISKMTGRYPLNRLSKMYGALELYAGQFDCCEQRLQEACDAVEDDDLTRFKETRRDLVRIVKRRMADAQDHLFDHDGDVVSAEDAVIVKQFQVEESQVKETQV